MSFYMNKSNSNFYDQLTFLPRRTLITCLFNVIGHNSFCNRHNPKILKINMIFVLVWQVTLVIFQIKKFKIRIKLPSPIDPQKKTLYFLQYKTLRLSKKMNYNMKRNIQVCKFSTIQHPEQIKYKWSFCSLHQQHSSLVLWILLFYIFFRQVNHIPANISEAIQPCFCVFTRSWCIKTSFSRLVEKWCIIIPIIRII